MKPDTFVKKFGIGYARFVWLALNMVSQLQINKKVYNDTSES